MLYAKGSVVVGMPDDVRIGLVRANGLGPSISLAVPSLLGDTV
jgi:hypothetical protein